MGVPFWLDTANGHLYFVGDEGAGQGWELYVSNGTAGGTHLHTDINPGRGDGLDWNIPKGVTEHDGYIFFMADDGVNGRELWAIDTLTGNAQMMAEFVPGSGSPSLVRSFHSLNPLLIVAEATSGVGWELYKYEPVPLNLYLLQFEAFRQDEQQVNLSWQFNEVPDAPYALEVSADGEQFRTVGYFNCTTGCADSKTFTHRAKGPLYYRLRINKEKGVDYSSVRFVPAQPKEEWEVSIWPQPVSGQAILSTNYPLDYIEMVDALGKTVYRSERCLPGQKHLDLEAFWLQGYIRCSWSAMARSR